MKLTRSIGVGRWNRWNHETTYQINANDPYNADEIACRVYLTHSNWTLFFLCVLFMLIAQFAIIEHLVVFKFSRCRCFYVDMGNKGNPFEWAMNLPGAFSHYFFGSNKISSKTINNDDKSNAIWNVIYLLELNQRGEIYDLLSLSSFFDWIFTYEDFHCFITSSCIPKYFLIAFELFPTNSISHKIYWCIRWFNVSTTSNREINVMFHSES